jgi:putative ABC transport system substrate-binding protein
MKRLLLLLALLIAPCAAPEGAERLFRLGQLMPSAATLEYTRKVTFPELAQLGFEEGRNLVVEERIGDADAVDRLAQELVATKPDAIIAMGSDATRAARATTSTVPIVAVGALPRGENAPATLAQPGGNVTGIVILGTDLDGKRLDLLHEAVPGARRMAAVFVPGALYRKESEHEIRTVAERAGAALLPFDAGQRGDYQRVFASMREKGAQALVITAHADLYRDRAVLAKLALEAGLPTACEWAEMAEAGCLLGYGPDRQELFRRVAHYVAQIFAGRKPGELPIEQPTHYKFAVNLNTANTLGLTLPPTILARADEVIG